MEAIVLAGGFGTRLKSLVADVPKPMAPIQGRPFLEFLLQKLGADGFRKVVLSVGYKAETIVRHFGSSFAGLSIVYSYEEEPLGTGGALRQSLELICDQRAFVVNGDTFLNLDYRAMLQRHLAVSAAMTIAVMQVRNTRRFGNVVCDVNGRIIAFSEKIPADSLLINAGVYAVERNLFDNLELPRRFSLEQDFLAPKCSVLQPLAFLTNSYFIDIGVPEDYQKAQTELMLIARD